MRARPVLLALAALLALALVAAIALRPAGEPSPPTASPSPTAAASPSPGPTASPTAANSPTPQAPPLLRPVSYESPVFGYRMQLPEGFRRSDCFSGVSREVSPDHPILGGDTFTLLSPDKERVDWGHVAPPMVAWTISVTVWDADGMSALGGAAERGPTRHARTRIEGLLINGQEAARAVIPGGETWYVVRADDRMYVIALREDDTAGDHRPRPDVLPEGIVDSVAMTFRPGPAVPVPTPTPHPAEPPPGARGAALQLAGALEASDVDRVAEIITPGCWLTTGFPNAGTDHHAVEPYLEELRERFEHGALRVTVDPAVQVQGERNRPVGSPLFVRSEWTEGGRTTRTDLFLDEIDGHWYWVGALLHPPEP